MIRKLLFAAVLLATTQTANAASTDVVFRGGLNVTSTTTCPDWNPNKEFFLATYWVPVAGSTNGPDSVLTFHSGNGSAEGFELSSGTFTSTYQSVDTMHVYTRIGSYPAFVKVTSQNPATILTTTQKVTVTGAVKGFGFQSTCIVNFTMSLVRNLDP